MQGTGGHGRCTGNCAASKMSLRSPTTGRCLEGPGFGTRKQGGKSKTVTKPMICALWITAAVAAGAGDGASYYAAIGLPSSALPPGQSREAYSAQWCYLFSLPSPGPTSKNMQGFHINIG